MLNSVSLVPVQQSFISKIRKYKGMHGEADMGAEKGVWKH